MKQAVTMIICILIIIVGGVCEIKYLEKSSLYLISDVEYIKNAIENGNFTLASEQMDSTYPSWESVKNIWNIFINHEEIDDIEHDIIELKMYIEYEDSEEALVSLEKLKSDLEHAVTRQKLQIDNIL